MGRPKDIRKKIEGLRHSATEHEEKIKYELAKPYPDRRLIELWQKQIAGFQARIDRLEKRLKRRRY